MNNKMKDQIDARLANLTVEDDCAMVRNLTRKRRRGIRPLNVLAVACLCLSLTLTAFAANVIQNSESSFYLRILSTEQMAVADAAAEQYGADVYFEGLKSDDVLDQYFAINKLVEYFSDDPIRLKAIDAITPFLQSEHDQLRDAATFALSILTKTYDNPNIYHLANGSMVFTLFNNYSDYGSYNELWMIQNGEMNQFYSFDKPHMYITSIIPSPDKKCFAVTTCSNKSEYLVIFNLADHTVSSELIDSARILIAKDNGYALWQRMDFENYSGIQPKLIETGNNQWFDTGEKELQWLDDQTIAFSASLEMDVNYVDALITYNIATKHMEYSEIT